MSVIVPHRAVEAISTAKDPKKAIMEMAGDLGDVEVIGTMVLVGTYYRPEKTAGGIIRVTQNKEEDTWQGKVGLVMKLGPDAFRDDEGELFEQSAKVGEWCVYKVGDGWSLTIRDCPCRLIRDVNIRLKVKDPTIIL